MSDRGKNHVWRDITTNRAGPSIGRSSDVWKYNLSKNLWSIYICKGDIPPPRDGHTINYIGNGKFILFGGQGKPYDNDKSEKVIDNVSIKTFLIRELYNSMYILDANNSDVGVWSRVPEDGMSPMGRRGHTSSFYSYQLVDYHCNLYNSNDDNNSSSQNNDSCFDSSSKKQSVCMPYNTKRSFNSSNVEDRSIIVFGGSGMEPSKYTEFIFNDLWAHCIDASTWTKLETNGAKLKALFDHRAEIIEDTLIIVGGIVGSSNNSFYKESSAHATDVIMINIPTLTVSYLDLYDARGRTTQLGLHGFSMCIDYRSEHKVLVIFGGKNLMESQEMATMRQNKKKRDIGPALHLDINRGAILPVKLGTADLSPVSRYGHVGIACLPLEELYNEGATTAQSVVSNPFAEIDLPVMFIYGGSNVNTGGFCNPVIHKLGQTNTNYIDDEATAVGSRPTSAASRASKSSIVSKQSSKASSFIDGGMMLRDLEDDDDNDNDITARVTLWEKMHTSSSNRSNTSSSATSTASIGTDIDIRAPSNWNELKLALSYATTEKHSLHDALFSEPSTNHNHNHSHSHSHNTASTLPKVRSTMTAPGGKWGSLTKSTSKSMHRSGAATTANLTRSATRPGTSSTILQTHSSSFDGREPAVDTSSMTVMEKAVYERQRQLQRIKHLTETMVPKTKGLAIYRAKELYLKHYSPPNRLEAISGNDDFLISRVNSSSRKMTSSAKSHHHGSRIDAFADDV